MKKNKMIAYALAATLLVGGTFAGTKALFTNEATIDNDLVIETGKVDIQAVNDTGWILNGEKSYEGDKLVPGDRLVRNVEIKNNSNVPTKINVKYNHGQASEELSNAINSKFIKVTDPGITGQNLGSGESKIVPFEIKIGTPENNNEIDNNYQDKNFDLSNFIAQYTITAEQLTHNK